MTMYRAVVKYPLGATKEEKKAALIDGLTEIAYELVAEHDYDIADLEEAMAEAQSNGEMELEAKRWREEDEAAAESS